MAFSSQINTSAAGAYLMKDATDVIHILSFIFNNQIIKEKNFSTGLY